MNLELFIAKRIHFSSEKGNKRVSSPAIKIAIAGVTVGIAAMILSVAIIIGFKKEVRGKAIGFGSHIQINNANNSTSYETQPICVSDSLRQSLKNRKGIKQVDIFATKPGIVKTENNFQGIILKGVSKDYDWGFFKSNLIEGSVINKGDTTVSNQSIISKNIADKLELKVGDSFLCYFIQEPIRARKFNITGIYNTNFEDYDKLFIITDIGIIQNLNKWEEDQVSGIELLVDDYDKLDEIKQDLFFDMLAYQDKEGNNFFTRSIKELNPMIFNWLELLDMNVWILIILMLAISVFTMTSGLLIIILERVNMIGILKTLGARSYSIRKTFLYVASFLILKGMLWGNIIALSIVIVQKQFGIFKLDPESYYIAEVPIEFNILHILLINLGTLIVSLVMMVAPSYLIAKISPIKSIRYE